MTMKSSSANNSRLVYSSDAGRICPECGKPQAACVCRKKSAALAGDGVVRVRRESKGRGGKTVTVITGVPLNDTAVKVLATELKKRCGTGGTVKDGVIEIQGDHRELLLAELTSRGYRAKAAGG
ncbi:MAG: translation initiation factor Sui1 [Geobacter sp.]|nr:translation initiation factor Sui1 [Geobacter sp.]